MSSGFLINTNRQVSQKDMENTTTVNIISFLHNFLASQSKAEWVKRRNYNFTFHLEVAEESY